MFRRCSTCLVICVLMVLAGVASASAQQVAATIVRTVDGERVAKLTTAATENKRPAGSERR